LSSDKYAKVTAPESPQTFEEAFSDLEFMKLAIPVVEQGGAAYGFDLPIYDFSTGAKKVTGESFNLAAVAANQPVALIFGSYT